MAVRIIAQVGDTHRLKFEDMGKRRFLRLGASERNPDVVQGTLHTGDTFVPEVRNNTGTRNSDGSIEYASDALALMGLTLFEVTDEYGDNPFGFLAKYFITGAIAYLVTEDGRADRVGILASVREVPDEDHTDEDSEFERQYPWIMGPDFKEILDNRSVARELDAALAEYARDNQPELDVERAKRVVELARISMIQGGLNARQRAELDRLQTLQRVSGTTVPPAKDDEPEMLTGRLG